jgi:hypothetical protein
MTDLDPTTNAFARLLSFTFNESESGVQDEHRACSKSKLLRTFRRHGRVFDSDAVREYVGRASQESSESAPGQPSPEYRRRPSLRDRILKRVKSQKQPRVSIFREHLSSISSFRTSTGLTSLPGKTYRPCLAREQKADLNGKSIVARILGPSPVRKLMKRNKLEAHFSSIEVRLPLAPPKLPPFQRFSAIRASVIFQLNDSLGK